MKTWESLKDRSEERDLRWLEGGSTRRTARTTYVVGLLFLLTGFAASVATLLWFRSLDLRAEDADSSDDIAKIFGWLPSLIIEWALVLLSLGFGIAVVVFALVGRRGDD